MSNTVYLRGEPEWRRGSLLDQLPRKIHEELVALGRPVTYRVGDVLTEQGSSHSPVFFVLDGVVKATRAAQPDGLLMLLGLSLRGDAAGVADALLGKQSHVTYTAVKKTKAIVLPRDVFTAAIRGDHRALSAVCTVLAHEVRLRDMSLSFATMEVESRLIAFLGRLQSACGKPTPIGSYIDLGLRQSDYAAAIGASQPAVGKALRRLGKEGKIAVGYRGLYIKNRLSPQSPAVERVPGGTRAVERASKVAVKRNSL